MQRIAIIGCPGSGKTTLAVRLGAALQIPVHHLDRIFWLSGWISVAPEQFVREQEKILKTPRWIVDGNYGASMDLRLRAADTIVFLDLPTWDCLRAVFGRYWSHRRQPRADMPQGNAERLSPSFLWFILRYRSVQRPKVLRRVTQWGAGKRVVVLESRAAVEAFVHQATVPRELAASATASAESRPALPPPPRSS